MFSSDRTRLLSIICLALTIGAAVGACMTYAVLTSTTRIPNTAKLRTIGVDVFSDSACTTPVLQIDWGLIGPSEAKNSTVYVKNIGNSPVTLNLTTEDWSPSSAPSMLALSWDYDNTSIAPAGSLRTVFTLKASSVLGGFSQFNFAVVINGTC